MLYRVLYRRLADCVQFTPCKMKRQKTKPEKIATRHTLTAKVTAR